jgi:hypothetical protein
MARNQYFSRTVLQDPVYIPMVRMNVDQVCVGGFFQCMDFPLLKCPVTKNLQRLSH